MQHIIIVLFTIISLAANSQNLITNHNFEDNGGSLDNWTIASGTELRVNGSDHYAYLSGENGVLVQKVTALEQGKIYNCKIYFNYLFVKQTTGYGYALEYDSPLSLPTFSIGASDLKNFCNTNGSWTQLADSYTGNSIVESFSIVVPDGAFAIYICLGTKGALSKYEVDSVEFYEVEANEITFSVLDKMENIPLSNANIQFSHLENAFVTDASGTTTVSLVERSQPYTFTVQRDWYTIYSGSINVSDTTTVFKVELDSITELKTVETRISKYGDNATPYPLYAHLWNDEINYTSSMNTKIVEAFDYIIGGGGVKSDANISDQLHAIDPKFQIIKYQGGWSISRSEGESNKVELPYYRCGTLATAIDENATSFVVNKPSDNRGLGIVASTGSYTTWLRIGNELMKINAVSSTTNYPITVTVERGLDGTNAANHSSGQTITAPLYTSEPGSGNISYFSTVFNYREKELKENALNFARNNNIDGIWIDILVGWLGARSMTGGNYTLWDHNDETTLSNEDIIKYTKDALDRIYTGFYSQMGYYPVIYGNNVLYSSNLTPSDRGYVMVKNNQHPRGLDGFCHENSWGHMSDDSGNIDNDGDPVVTSDKYVTIGDNGHFLEWYMGDTWIDRCKTIALLAQENLPNQPMTINAGFKNRWFADDLSSQTRYDFNKYCYASYLMSVNVTEDSLISCRMGISPMVKSGNTYNIVIDSFFYRNIGIPLENKDFNNFNSYRYGNLNLYSRTFSKGLVLVNPFKNDMTIPVDISSVTGTDTLYVDPENGNSLVTSVQLKSREALILMKSKDQDVAVHNPFQEKGILRLYPVPTKDELFLNVVNTKAIKESASVRVYSNGKVVYQESVHFNSGETNINISHLPAGIYFVRVEGVQAVGKFVKY